MNLPRTSLSGVGCWEQKIQVIPTSESSWRVLWKSPSPIAFTDFANLTILLEMLQLICATVFKLVPLYILVLLAVASGKIVGNMYIVPSISSP